MVETTVIEINGVKLEVDLRTAKRIDTFRIGSKIKLLDKDNYGGVKIWPGSVVGFEPFQDLPTIIIAYLKVGYSDAELEFAYINTSEASIKKWEIIMSIDDELPVDKAEVLEVFGRKKQKLKNDIEELDRKEKYFMRNFGEYFKEPVEVS